MALGHDNSELRSQQDMGNLVEFDPQDRRYCWNSFGFSVHFELTNNSIQYLFTLVSNITHKKNNKQKKLLKLGDCVRNVSIYNIL